MLTPEIVYVHGIGGVVTRIEVQWRGRFVKSFQVTTIGYRSDIKEVEAEAIKFWEQLKEDKLNGKH